MRTHAITSRLNQNPLFCLNFYDYSSLLIMVERITATVSLELARFQPTM